MVFGLFADASGGTDRRSQYRRVFHGYRESVPRPREHGPRPPQSWVSLARSI
ncbi:hypothetical protein CURTO8I2_220057 [Curtobacterium sp. 8I-2]|nr:hypothetical protein CURTO8I2_220057 [Curtobacterium sp. 8I-2]